MLALHTAGPPDRAVRNRRGDLLPDQQLGGQRAAFGQTPASIHPSEFKARTAKAKEGKTFARSGQKKPFHVGRFGAGLTLVTTTELFVEK